MIELTVSQRLVAACRAGEVWVRADFWERVREPVPFEVRLFKRHHPGRPPFMVRTAVATLEVAEEVSGGGRGRKHGDRYVKLVLVCGLECHRRGG